jgi:hypothetical protein
VVRHAQLQARVELCWGSDGFVRCSRGGAGRTAGSWWAARASGRGHILLLLAASHSSTQCLSTLSQLAVRVC